MQHRYSNIFTFHYFKTILRETFLQTGYLAGGTEVRQTEVSLRFEEGFHFFQENVYVIQVTALDASHDVKETLIIQLEVERQLFFFIQAIHLLAELELVLTPGKTYSF
jgi:hypothetical protein